MQHEIAHLNGQTIHDFESKPFISGGKINRNDKVTIRKGSEEKIIKYKKVESYLADEWELV